MERVHNILKNLNGYGLTLPSLLAVLPFIISAFITIRVTYGDATQAKYIISEIGFIQLWTQGASALILTYIPIILAALMVYFARQAFKLKNIPMGIATLIIAVYVFYTTEILLIIAAIIFVFIIGPIIDNNLNKKAEPRKKEIENIGAELTKLEKDMDAGRLEKLSDRVKTLKNEDEKRSTSDLALLLIGALSILAIIIWSYPTLPQTSITKKDNSIVKGMVMNRSEVRTVIYDTDSDIIKVVQTTEVAHEEVCDKHRDQALYGFNWSIIRHILEYTQSPSVPYVTCKE